VTWRSLRRCRQPTLLSNSRNYGLSITSLADTLISAKPLTYPLFHFPFSRITICRYPFSLAPRFADQPMKEMRINTERNLGQFEALLPLLQLHWQGIVFPHVEYLETDRWPNELDLIPNEFWREFLSNVDDHVILNGHLDSAINFPSCFFFSTCCCLFYIYLCFRKHQCLAITLSSITRRNLIIFLGKILRVLDVRVSIVTVNLKKFKKALDSEHMQYYMFSLIHPAMFFHIASLFSVS
jgi:hypothetical protein